MIWLALFHRMARRAAFPKADRTPADSVVKPQTRPIVVTRADWMAIASAFIEGRALPLRSVLHTLKTETYMDAVTIFCDCACSGNPSPTCVRYSVMARAVALWLDRFCNRNLPYPEMVEDAARRAGRFIELVLLSVSEAGEKTVDRQEDLNPGEAI